MPGLGLHPLPVPGPPECLDGVADGIGAQRPPRARLPNPLLSRCSVCGDGAHRAPGTLPSTWEYRREECLERLPVAADDLVRSPARRTDAEPRDLRRLNLRAQLVGQVGQGTPRKPISVELGLDRIRGESHGLRRGFPIGLREQAVADVPYGLLGQADQSLDKEAVVGAGPRATHPQLTRSSSGPKPKQDLPPLHHAGRHHVVLIRVVWVGFAERSSVFGWWPEGDPALAVVDKLRILGQGFRVGLGGAGRIRGVAP